MRSTVTSSSLSVVIPTKGRESLAETVASIPGWAEVVVVADGQEAYERALALGRGSVYECGPSILGHPQRQLGMQKASGDWLCFIDDDDVYTDKAFPAFQDAMRGRLPRLFRMEYEESGVILWNERRVAHCNVGTPMLLTPNVSGKLGEWAWKRTGDYDFIRDTVANFGGCWFDETIVCTVRRLDYHPYYVDIPS